MESELLWGLKDIFSLNGFVEISSEMKACFLHLPWNLLPPTWWVTKTLYPPAPAPPPQSHCGPPVKNICPPLASILCNIKGLQERQHLRLLQLWRWGKTHLALWASISSEVGPFWTWRWTAGPGGASEGSRQERGETLVSGDKAARSSHWRLAASCRSGN